jgi:hypothetical protein
VGGLVLTTVVRYRDAEVARRVRSLSPHGALGYQEGMFNMIASMNSPSFTRRLRTGELKSIVSNVPDPNDSTTCEFYLAHSVLGESPQGLDNATIMKNLKSHGEKLAEPFRSSIMDIPDTTKVFNDRLYYWVQCLGITKVGELRLLVMRHIRYLLIHRLCSSGKQ